MFFLLILLDDRRIQIHISDYWIRIRIREGQKFMDPTNPDRQHCFVAYGHLAAMPNRARMKMRKRRQAVLPCQLCIFIFFYATPQSGYFACLSFSSFFIWRKRFFIDQELFC
jgi:hypothetical protein